MKEPGNYTSISGVPEFEASISEEMRAFDILPQPIRRALSNCAFDYSALNVLNQMRSRHIPGSVAASIISKQDDETIAIAYAERGIS